MFIKEFFKLFSEKWVEDNGIEQKLPGHTFNPKQLFWLSYTSVSSWYYIIYVMIEASEASRGSVNSLN